MSISQSSLRALSSLSSLKLSGLASGMDTESMVESLMRVERLKYEALEKQKTKMDWKSEANLEVNNLLRGFRDDFLSKLKTENYMLDASSVMLFNVTTDTPTGSVKLTAGKDALAGSHTINSITSLASGANTAGTLAGTAVSLDTQLSALALTTPLDFSSGSISFKINGETFSFAPTDTLRNVINKVNGNTAANVQMSYSSLTGKLTIANRKMGSATNLVIENLTGNAFDAATPAFGIQAGTYTNGTDARLSIDGVAVVRDTNTFTIDGITYNLKGTSGSAVPFTVEQNVDDAVKKIKAFVDAYNTLYTKLQGKVDEKVYSDYQPLSDSEKESLSDTQVEKWETLAKSGTLHNDSYVKKLLQDMRKSFYDAVGGADSSAAALGIGTVSYLTGGLMQVDETKLRTALQTNPQQVADVLGKMSASTSASTKYSESGLAARFQTTISNYLNDYQGYRTDSFNDQYDDLEDRMSRMERTLQAKEDRYWQQFNRMEEALSQLNSQSSWLSSQLSSMGS